MTESDNDLATRLATTAGRILLEVRASGLLSGKSLGATGDALANQWLTKVLRELRPDDGLLSEEEAPDSARLGKRRIWIVDPLDGTREYSEGRADWAVHVALAVDGVPTVAAVALPGVDAVLSTAAPVHPPSDRSSLRIAVSRSRPSAVAEYVANKLGAELVPMGSAGYKAMAVVRGEVDAYIHAGGQYEWDSAAPVGVALHAGLYAGDLDGTMLTYGNYDPWSPQLLICRAEIKSKIVSAIAEFSEV